MARAQAGQGWVEEVIVEDSLEEVALAGEG